MNESKTWIKFILIIVLFLIFLPLAIFILIQFASPKEIPPQNEVVTAETSDEKAAAHQERHARRENRAVRQETASMESEDNPVFEEVGAISPYATRSKQATPYRPGTVPGDSGVVVQYAGSPDDMGSGPQPPPQDDLWGGRTLPPIPPENMRGIDGVRRIDPDDPFFRQEIPNPFAE